MTEGKVSLQDIDGLCGTSKWPWEFFIGANKPIEHYQQCSLCHQQVPCTGNVFYYDQALPNKYFIDLKEKVL